MNTNPDLEDVHDEVLRKIGRNLLLFQQAELLIKRIVVLESLSIRAGESPSNLEERSAFCRKMTMGQVANLFLTRICPAVPSSDSNPVAETPGHDGSGIALRVRIGIGLDQETRKQSFNHLIEQRNDLVHHQLERLYPESIENYRRIADELDCQRREILPEVLRLQQDLESVRSMLEVLTSFLDTPAGMAELLQPEIQQSPLVRNLAEIAAKSTDPEGWAALGEATRQLQDFPSKEILKHCAQFGQKSLSALLLASGLFHVEQREANETSHGRTFYRLIGSGIPAPSSASVSVALPLLPPEVCAG